jgi:hypothetical protein
MNCRCFIVVLATLLVVQNTSAQGPAGTRQGEVADAAQANAAAHEEAERQTIGAGLWILNAGVCAEDLQLIKSLLYAQNDPKLALVEAHARRIVASKRFSDAAEKAFGAEAAGELALMDLSAFGMGLLAPTWKIEGNTASPAAENAAVLAANGIILPRLVNRRGVWKVDVTPTPAPTPNGVAALAAAIEKYARIVDDVTSAIADRKLKTVGEVKAALKSLPEFARPVEYTPDVVLALPPVAASTTAPENR